MVLGTPILYKTIACDANPLVQKFLGTALVLQSFYFITKMFSILKSRSSEYSERKRKGVKMQWFQELTKEQVAKIDLYNAKGKIKIPWMQENQTTYNWT